MVLAVCLQHERSRHLYSRGLKGTCTLPRKLLRPRALSSLHQGLKLPLQTQAFSSGCSGLFTHVKGK